MEQQLKTAVSQSGKTYGLTGNTKRTRPRNHSKDREAREAWLRRKEDRPIQVTSDEEGHVVGYVWIRVDMETVTQLEDIIEDGD